MENKTAAKPAADVTVAPAIEMRGVAKSYGACQAARDISLVVPRGTIHAIIGENGAGKSTAMKMLYGMVKPDAGEIRVDGSVASFRSPRDANRAGLGMVHQHFMLAGPHSGLDNILLGAEPTPKSLLWRLLPQFLRPIDRKSARARLQQLADTYNFKVDLDAPVSSLAVGVQQRLEILKVLFRDARVLILDEPTAVLTPQETVELFQNLRRLRDEGKTIIIITHKLKEVMSLADDVTVFRRGEVVARTPVAGATEAGLAALMVGRAVRLTAEVPPAPKLGASTLTVRDVTLGRKGHKPLLDRLSFEVRAGEIVGIAGIEGNGQSELLELLQDPRRHYERGIVSGELQMLGHAVKSMPALAMRALGVGIVPEDRHRQGLILTFDLTSNFALGLQREARFTGGRVWMHKSRLRERVGEVIHKFDIRPAQPDAKAGSLSGGNQQKLVVARELERQPKLLVCAQPTRGVDVGSIEFIHARMIEARNAGAGVLLVSSSLEEIMALSDRILVLYEGRMVGEFARGACGEATLGAYMSGVGGKESAHG